MRCELLDIPAATPGTRRSLTVQRFGTPGARPRVHLQASLHADEVPAMLVADKLRRILAAWEAQGRLVGEIVLVPVANPIGLAQSVLSAPVGRFDLGDGRNFNRDFPALSDALAERAAGRLTGDADANLAAVRAALGEALAGCVPQTPVEQLKHRLLDLALPADVVLDLHSDAEAVVHLYTLPDSAAVFAPLQRLLGAAAVLLAEESGGDPFDEALSRPWLALRRRWPDRPIPFGCHAATVELRGQADVAHGLAEADAAAIAGFLVHLGAAAGDPPALPDPLCAPTPLEAVEPLVAPAAGVLVFHCAVGDRLEAGDRVADIVDPLDGSTVAVRSGSAGLLYARVATRFATPGLRIAKVAGTALRRSGPLLGA